MYDGNAATAPSLGGKMCGQAFPQPIIATGNKAFIQFTSDHTVTCTGFAIHVDARKYFSICIHVNGVLNLI